ncbi:YkvA family protein [Sporosarcina sp. G11-34]|uniref:YkvA family protein n=1 Tax=Sporosarcina sp. G11-34 TaxID=2849605 RepID=UPI0022A90B48|nr:YkvA family protein [Sporosarcina sp. G11-34]MCZ2259667.1 DUF1232 domain-containing protein [Sporosarcina sp. G11-34]
MSEKQKKYEEQLKDFNPEVSMKNMENHYSDRKFWDKVKKYGEQIGKKTVYYSLLLFYAAKSPSVPKSSKMIIIGALSYLIFPVDLIPDFIPVVGLADDAAVIATAVYKVVSHLDDGIKSKAKQKLNSLFNDTSDIEL